MHGIVLTQQSGSGNGIAIIVPDLKLTNLRFTIATYYDMKEDQIKINLDKRYWIDIESKRVDYGNDSVERSHFVKHDFEIVTVSVDHFSNEGFGIHLRDISHIILLTDMNPATVIDAIRKYNEPKSCAVYQDTKHYYYSPSNTNSYYYVYPINVVKFGF